MATSGIVVQNTGTLSNEEPDQQIGAIHDTDHARIHSIQSKHRCTKLYRGRAAGKVRPVPAPAIKASDSTDSSWPPVSAASTTSAAVDPETPPETDAPPETEAPQESAAAPAAPEPADEPSECHAVAVIREFYAAYNRGEMGTMADRFSEDAVYHDAIYLEPFFGREAIAAYFNKFKENSATISDLKFVISEITGSGNQCGVCWHTELDGALFPFSRGCSFYVVDDAGKITWGRDCVESSPPKPGDSTIAALGVLGPVLRSVGVERSDPANLSKLPLQAAAMWAFYAGYMWWMLFSADAPGVGLLYTSQETLTELLHESLNFFYVNIALAAANLTPIPSIAEHPVSEAVFNFVNAWGMMFLPVILTEKRSQKVPRKLLQWTGIMFLTNIFFIPFLAQRFAPDPHPSGLEPAERTRASLYPADAAEILPAAGGGSAAPAAAKTPAWHRAVGGVGLFIGTVSAVWWAAARPEYGDVGARVAFFQDAMANQRVFYAFVVDAGLYGFWQAWMMDSAGAPRKYCAVPFFGLGAWLLAGRPKGE